MSLENLTITIPTLNEEENIHDCLKVLLILEAKT